MTMQQPILLVTKKNSDHARKVSDMLGFLGRTTKCCNPEDLQEMMQNYAHSGIVLTSEIVPGLTPDVIDSINGKPLLLISGGDGGDGGDSDIETIPGLNTECLQMPCNYHDLNTALAKLITSRKSCRRSSSVQSIEGDSAAINKVRRLIEQVANTDASVLILGESGTGKEIVARMLHRQSDRVEKPFIPVNCGAIPKELLESELFGHEKGAFTGAVAKRVGRFEMAEGGTLFLDEIGDMDQEMQVKLLRVLQEKSFERVGGGKTQKADVRIIAATHRNLERSIEQGDFREDLFYRLNVFPIEMPALRERDEDIPALIESMIGRLANERGAYEIDKSAMDILQYYCWPGNVRELSNLVERLRILYSGETIFPANLPQKYSQLEAAVHHQNDHEDDLPKNTRLIDTQQIDFVASDPGTLKIVGLAKRAASTDVSVLVTGNSGTGKEMLARYIHDSSPRAGHPFVVINCAAIPENMLEEVLFGCEAGVFGNRNHESPSQSSPGKFEQAQNGTVLLDNILEMKHSIQVKILRVLQEREVERVGGKEPVRLNVRILATTNGDLHKAVENGDFREDLYYRLNVFPILLTPLCERSEDILPLATALINKYIPKNKLCPGLSAEARKKLLSHDWGGNVRELGNVLQRSLVLCNGETIEEPDIQLETLMLNNSETSYEKHSLNTGLRSHEQDLILEALNAGNGSRKTAAEELGISPRTLRYKLAKMRENGINIP